MESKERKALFSNETVHHDKIYYQSGQIKSLTKARYKEPQTTDAKSDPGRKFNMMKYKNYTMWYENGNKQEKGKLKEGTGIIKEYDESGNLTKTKKVNRYITTETHDVINK